MSTILRFKRRELIRSTEQEATGSYPRRQYSNCWPCYVWFQFSGHRTTAGSEFRSYSMEQVEEQVCFHCSQGPIAVRSTC